MPLLIKPEDRPLLRFDTTALHAADKSFGRWIYKDAPGGRSFDRIDTDFARNAGINMCAFLEKCLK